MVKRPVADRFWEKVSRGEPHDCWHWQASTDHCGYGRIIIAGSVKRAHRISYAINVGPIPAGLRVLHRCDNPPCVNPDHLFLGTQAENIADMIAKGRDRKRPMLGSDSPTAKLTSEQVIEIRHRMAAGATQNAIAADFGISNGHAWRIAHRVRWAHLGEI